MAFSRNIEIEDLAWSPGALASGYRAIVPVLVTGSPPGASPLSFCVNYVRPLRTILETSRPTCDWSSCSLNFLRFSCSLLLSPLAGSIFFLINEFPGQNFPSCMNFSLSQHLISTPFCFLILLFYIKPKSFKLGRWLRGSVPQFSHLWKMGFISRLAYCVGFCEMLQGDLVQLLVHEKGYVVSLLLPIGCPGKPISPRQTGIVDHPGHTAVNTLAEVTSGDVLYHTPFSAFSSPLADKRIWLWVTSPVREWVESGGQNIFWRALGWKSLFCDIIYLPGEGRQKTDWETGLRIIQLLMGMKLVTARQEFVAF